jgi:hypothetical protein
MRRDEESSEERKMLAKLFKLIIGFLLAIYGFSAFVALRTILFLASHLSIAIFQDLSFWDWGCI